MFVNVDIIYIDVTSETGYKKKKNTDANGRKSNFIQLNIYNTSYIFVNDYFYAIFLNIFMIIIKKLHIIYFKHLPWYRNLFLSI
jgi:hypothetical protein